MKRYDVTITETLEKIVSVEAASEKEALEKVEQGYCDCEYVLDADNFVDVDFKAKEKMETNSTDGKIDVLLVEPGEYPKPWRIGTELEDLQAAVGGYIQVIYPYDDPVGLICNEEGKITGLPLNRALLDADGQMYDIIAGSFLVVGLSDDGFCSLTPELMKKYAEMFRFPQMFMR